MPHQPDVVTAKDAGGGFAPHAEGQFAMICVDVVDLGINVETYAGQEAREVAKVALVFASGERQGEGDKSELTLVTTEMTNSANEKANLRKFLEAWRGRAYTAEQAEAGLPLHKLHGKFALVSIEHVTTRKGRKFAKINAIQGLPEQIKPPDAKSILAEYERPKFLTDRKAQYAEALKKHRAAMGDDVPEPEYPGDDDSDSVPF
jgi:hypothetical protein